MRISEHLRAGFALVVLGGFVAACDPAALSGAPSRTSVDVAGVPVAVVAPAGFCIDRESMRAVDDGAFVLMADCALLSGTVNSAEPPLGAAFTATILPGSLGGEGAAPAESLDGLRYFASTDEGRALLAGDASGQARILQTIPGEGVLFVLVDERGGAPVPGVVPRYWRAFVALDGRFAVLSALSFDSGRADEQVALDRLASLAANLRRANP